MIDLRNTALVPLTHYAQWVAWRIEDRSGKPTKVPYSPRTGHGASSVNPADWGTYDEAAKYAAAHGMAGVGFVLTAADPFYCLDLDACLINGAWSPTAVEMWSHMGDQVAAELSQSGHGLHMWGMYDPATPRAHRQRVDGRELYTDKRFIAVTGNMVGPGQMTDYDRLFAWLVETHFKPEAPTLAFAAGWTDGPVPEWSGPEDDDELIRRALRAKKQSASEAFTGKPDDKLDFRALWEADDAALGAVWPPQNDRDAFNRSSADASLATRLAYWTGKDCERIERLMRRSALARDKWDDHGSYLRNTIIGACATARDVYSGSATPTPPPDPEIARATGFKLRAGHAVASHDEQMQMFAGCIYVAAPHKIVTPRGQLYDQGRFDAMFGGWQFKLDLEGKKLTTSAWEAFTRAQAWVPERADRVCFRPEHGGVGVIEEGHLRLANTYAPAQIDMIEGDPSPFVRHMKKMLPDGDDCEILLTYMASVAQNPGMKAQWWPVVQGAQGNFKSTLLDIMAHAVGPHYAHMPNMKKMVKGDSNFNGWIERKLFLGLDEVYAADRREFFEGFKTTVTNLSLAVEGKGVEEVTSDNRANGLIVTNHQDGVPISGDNRRYAPFFCAQQTPEDMIRDGMTNDYITDLSDWLRGRGRYAEHGPNYGVKIMAHHLHTRALHPAYDPKTCVRAPRTSSTDRAIHAGLGRVEQEVEEAIAAGEPGFAGGWVSAHFLKMLLGRERLSLPRGKYKDVMKSLGYEIHPALVGGRTNGIVAPDGKKVQLFCKTGSIAWSNLTEPAAVAAAYTKAQSSAAGDAAAATFTG